MKPLAKADSTRDRTRVRLRELHDLQDNDWLECTPAGRMAAVWPLTLAAWAVAGDADATTPPKQCRHLVIRSRRREPSSERN